MANEHWREIPLGEVVNLKRGYDLPTRQRQPGPFPVVSSSGFTGTHDEAKVGPPGVVTGRYGTLGQVYIVDEPFWPLNTTLYVQDFKDNDPLYVAYLLESLDLAGLVASAAVPGINRNHLHPLPVRIPEVWLQRELAAAVAAFDGLIQNNRRRIEMLEKMARLIYREWFVHFRFPGHEEVELVKSDLGPIPDGWTVVITADLISAGTLEIGDGYRAKNSEFDEHGHAFVRVKNVAEGYLDLADVDYLPEPYGETVGGKRGRPGDCVISMKGTVGRMGFVNERTPPLIYSPQVSYWRPLEPDRLSSEYLRLWMQSPVFVEQCARVKGATDMADYVNLRDQRTMRLVLPSQPVHAAFVVAVSPLLALVDNLRSQMEVLESARHLMLPRLISGELDVSDLDLVLEPVV